MSPGDPNGLEQRPTIEDFLASHSGLNDRSPDAIENARRLQQEVNALARQQGIDAPAQLHPPLNAHDVEEAMRPYLGEVYEAEQDDAALGSRPTRLERAYRAALDHLLDLNGVHR